MVGPGPERRRRVTWVVPDPILQQPRGTVAVAAITALGPRVEQGRHVSEAVELELPVPVAQGVLGPPDVVRQPYRRVGSESVVIGQQALRLLDRVPQPCAVRRGRCRRRATARRAD